MVFSYNSAVSSPASMPLIEAALGKKFVIPEFGEFASKVDELYSVCADIEGGKVN